ncbi:MULTISPECIES: hypothetical protein [unclassified Brevundimonas]|uniref:hypothetical protein n=1 Tax=unclassified Brevundimonas TaxID=2622653 RepID=UPI0020033CB0|nr:MULTISPECIES: hypothetical protein [unclassified Brevundimonas]MCK6104485.1 hypothetical protein [Brevundimonas sp. EYE_349]
MPDRLLPMMIAAALALSGSFPAAAAAQAPPPEDPGLIAYLRQRALGALDTTRYTAALTPDGRTMLVYLTGPSWCGSGGCRLLVLDRAGGTYRSVGEISVARAPIRLLERQSHGRRDLGVQVAGGGITEAYEAAVPFDGRRYARNPTVAPAVRIEDAPGETLIRADEPGRPLVPSPDKP